MNSTVRKIIVASIVGLFFAGSVAVGGAKQYPDMPAVAQVGFLLSGLAFGATLGFAADFVVVLVVTKLVKAKRRKALISAILKGNIIKVESILSKGVDVNSKEYGDFTPFQYAVGMVHNKDVDIIKCLVSAGADVNARDGCGYTPLWHAVDNNDIHVGHNNIEVVKFLVSAGADVNGKQYGQNNGLIPLWHVVYQIRNFIGLNNIEVFKFLVSAGADVNAKTKDGEFPLDLCHFKSEMVATPTDPWGDVFLLHFAVFARNIDIVKCLVSAGADVNAKNVEGRTPLHFARNIDIVKCLVSAGADVNAKTVADSIVAIYKDNHHFIPKGSTPLDVAKIVGFTEAVEYLSSLE